MPVPIWDNGWRLGYLMFSSSVDAGQRPTPQRVVWGIALAACLLRLFFWYYTGRTWEDALITVLHSENAVNGLGLTHYHPGQPPIHGFTSPLSVLIPLAGDLVHAGWGLLLLKLVSALIVIPTILLAASIAGHPSFKLNVWLVYLLCGYLAFEHHQILWGMGGMETQVAVFVLFLTLYTALNEDYTALGISMALCVYARPDFVLFLIPVVLYVFLTKRAALLKTLVIAGVLYAPWLLFTTLYYGSPVPHTIVAKSLGYSLWSKYAPLFSHDFWSHTWERIYDHIFLLLGLGFAGHGPILKLADNGLISRICLAIILAGTVAMAFRFHKFYIIPLGSLVIYSIYYIYLVPVVFEWYLVPFSAMNCLILVFALGALFDILVPPAWIPTLSKVVCVAYIVPFIAVTPSMFKWEKGIQEYVETPVRKSIGEYLFTHKKPGETVGSESLGYLAYYSRMPVYDYPGLANLAVTDFMKRDPHPGSLYRMLAAFKPDWILLRWHEWEGFYGGEPLNDTFMKTSYQLEKAFHADTRQTEGIYRINYNIDRVFYLFKKRSPGDQVTEATPTRIGPALSGGVSIKGAWSLDGAHPEAGRVPVEGAVYGSWSGKDANVGSLRLGPYVVQPQSVIAIPMVTGPSTDGLSLQILNAKTGKPVASLNPVPQHREWWVWKVELPAGIDDGIEIAAEDAGSGWGQWLGVGVPHSVVSQIGAELTDVPVAIQGSWTKGGYPSVVGRSPFEGTIYGSWSGSYANVGTLRLGPFRTGGQAFIAIPIVTAPHTVTIGGSVKVLNARTGKVIASMNPPPNCNYWWAWKVAIPPEPDVRVEIVAEDYGSDVGQWMAVGVPHAVQ